jgi:hypothetical protein
MSSRVAAYPHARRIDHGEIGFVGCMLVPVRMRVAEEAILGTVGTDERRGQRALRARVCWRIVPREKANGRAIHRSPPSLQNVARQGCRTTEIILVVEFDACGRKCSPCSRGHRELAAVDGEGAHVPTAFQPELAEKRIEPLERGICAHLHINPIPRVVLVLDPKPDQELRPTSGVGRGSARREMARHLGFRHMEAAQRAGTSLC